VLLGLLLAPHPLIPSTSLRINLAGGKIAVALTVLLGPEAVLVTGTTGGAARVIRQATGLPAGTLHSKLRLGELRTAQTLRLRLPAPRMPLPEAYLHLLLAL